MSDQERDEMARVSHKETKDTLYCMIVTGCFGIAFWVGLYNLFV